MLSAAELEHELAGSAKEVEGCKQRLDIIRYEQQESWMTPYPVQAVFSLTLHPFPIEELNDDEQEDEMSPEQRQARPQEIQSAPLHLYVAACLPAGYALVEQSNSQTTSTSTAASSSSITPSFSFYSPLLLKDSFHNLLLAVSPVYRAWKEREMQQKLAQLFQLQQQSEEEEEEEGAEA